MKRTNCVWTLTPKPIYWNKWLPTEELELKKMGKGRKYVLREFVPEISCWQVDIGNIIWQIGVDQMSHCKTWLKVQFWNMFSTCNQGEVVMYPYTLYRSNLENLCKNITCGTAHQNPSQFHFKPNPSILTRLWYFNLSTLFANEFETHTFLIFEWTLFGGTNPSINSRSGLHHQTLY